MQVSLKGGAFQITNEPITEHDITDLEETFSQMSTPELVYAARKLSMTSMDTRSSGGKSPRISLRGPSMTSTGPLMVQVRRNMLQISVSDSILSWSFSLEMVKGCQRVVNQVLDCVDVGTSSEGQLRL